jgi:predicted RNase H-like HicB family nuclease
MAKGRVVELTDEVVEEAERIVRGYSTFMKPHSSSGYMGYALELPAVVARGETQEECLSALRESLIHSVAMMLAQDRKPPVPARDRKVEQINVRLSAEEKLALMELARKDPAGVTPSDLIRRVLREKLSLPCEPGCGKGA